MGWVKKKTSPQIPALPLDVGHWTLDMPYPLLPYFAQTLLLFLISQNYFGIENKEVPMAEAHTQKASDELLKLMNRAVAREMQVSIQYMWQHIQWVGVKGFTVRDQLKLIAINEMTHAEMIADRLNYLGGVPTTKPDEINVGDTLKEMIQNNTKAEEEAIALYKQIIKKCRDEDDVVTRKLFEQILQDEENHLDMFEGWLGDL